MKIPKHHSPNIFTIDNFWSKEMCDEYISLSESIGYSEALIKTDLGYRKVNHIRNNLRVLYDNHDLANSIWKDLKANCPKKVGNSYPIGLNERFRFYKYNNGHVFKKHRDMSFIRDESECSYYTFMIYLNQDFAGGSTTFNKVEIKPKTGMALLFYHPLEHEGAIIESGIKYVLRTDVMFRLKDSAKPGFNTSND